MGPPAYCAAQDGQEESPGEGPGSPSPRGAGRGQVLSVAPRSAQQCVGEGKLRLLIQGRGSPAAAVSSGTRLSSADGMSASFSGAGDSQTGVPSVGIPANGRLLWQGGFWGCPALMRPGQSPHPLQLPPPTAASLKPRCCILEEVRNQAAAEVPRASPAVGSKQVSAPA